MNEYKFTFGYLALKMLGKTLYNNPFAALSELIANGFDAGSRKVWIYIDIREKTDAQIVIIDCGKGMTDKDIKDKYLQVGQKNRPDNDNLMMGRKGIGKLAAFYLSNHYYISSKTKQESNSYEINFEGFETGEKNENDEYMRKIQDFSFPFKNIYEQYNTGTIIYLTKVNFAGYGEKSFEVLNSNLSELFCFNNLHREIYIKLVSTDDDLTKEFSLVKKNIAYKNMCKILYNTNSNNFNKVLLLNGKEIKNSENLSKESKSILTIEKFTNLPRVSIVQGREIQINPTGWIGIHQTIDREKAHNNDPENFVNSRFYNFNKVRIYVRGKLALENILPYVHNTQYYVNYIEGEFECDELDANEFPDIASSSRQDFDKNDDRFIALVEFVSAMVAKLVKFKNDQTNEDLKLKKKAQENAVNNMTREIESSIKKKLGKKLKESDLENVKHTITNSFEKVKESAKVDYTIFLSHKRTSKEISDFIYYFLTGAYKFDPKMIFYTSKNGGVDQTLMTLEKQINLALTSTNTYVVFVIDKDFKQSEFCMFEGGAVWATKQKDVIGLFYKDYKNSVPEYLKNMRSYSIEYENTQLTADLYIRLVKFLNSLIEYLNRNYVLQKNQKPLLIEDLPDSVELHNSGKDVSEYFDKKVVSYWNQYVLGVKHND